LQESAPAGQPWTPLLLSAGALPVLASTQASAANSSAASAPALSPSLRSNRPGEHTEDVVDYGSQGSDPNTTPATAAAPPLTNGSPDGTRERMGLTVERIEEGSQGTDPNPVPAPGTAAAREDSHNATGEVIVGVDDRKRVLATTTYPWCVTEASCTPSDSPKPTCYHQAAQQACTYIFSSPCRPFSHSAI